MAHIHRISPLDGRRPTRTELPDFVDGPVDGILGPEPRLLIVGINPGLWTAAVNAPFAHPGNRFWPSLHESGLTPRRVDASAGLAEADEQMMHDQRIAHHRSARGGCAPHFGRAAVVATPAQATASSSVSVSGSFAGVET